MPERRPAGLSRRRHPGPYVPATAGGCAHAAPSGDPAGAEDKGGSGAAAAGCDGQEERRRRGGPAQGFRPQAGVPPPAAAGAGCPGCGLPTQRCGRWAAEA